MTDRITPPTFSSTSFQYSCKRKKYWRHGTDNGTDKWKQCLLASYAVQPADWRRKCNRNFYYYIIIIIDMFNMA